MSSDFPIRVLVVDDSAAGRAAIADILVGTGQVEIVGWAMDGLQALRLVHDLKPDAITLDLEMPEMDGFTFLRLLMAQRATPVVVVSTDSRPEASLTALELGAVDFVVKPHRLGGQSLVKMGQELAQKIIIAAGCDPLYDAAVSRPSANAGKTLSGFRLPPEHVDLIVIGASTGGPMAVQTLLQGIREPLDCAIVIAQHMPSPFTNAYAKRLNGMLPHYVTEACDGDLLNPGRVLISPGGLQTYVVRRFDGALMLKVQKPEEDQSFAPSVDLLFASAASLNFAHTLAVVLTGMGADGAVGAKEIEEAGGYVVTESEETALINGMPESARRTCAQALCMPLPQIPRLMQRLGTLVQTS